MIFARLSLGQVAHPRLLARGRRARARLDISAMWVPHEDRSE